MGKGVAAADKTETLPWEMTEKKVFMTLDIGLQI